MHQRSAGPRRCLRAVLACFLVLLCVRFGSLARAQGLSPGGPVDFGSTPVGTAAGKISLNFTAVVTTTISGVQVVTEGAANGDFTLVGQNCLGTQAPPATCLITLQFLPTAVGLRKGWLSVTDSTGAVVNNVPLRGVGIGPLLVLTSPVTATATNQAPGLSPANFVPSASVRDGHGNLYFNDIANNRLLRQATDGTVTQLATLHTSSLSALAINGYGTLFASSPTEGAVYSLTPSANGYSPPVRLLTPGVTLVTPTGLAVDGSGYLYLADAGSNSIVRLTADGSSAVNLTLSGLTMPLLHPNGLALAAAHILFVADSGNHRIVRFSLINGQAAPFALSGATLTTPTALAVSPSDTLTVADTGNARFVSVAADGTTVPLALPGVSALEPAGVAFTPNGDVLLADASAGLITVARSSGAYTFPTTTAVGRLDTTDGSYPISLSNQGNAALPFNSGNPSQTGTAFNLNAAGTTCPAAAPLAGDASCTYAVSFTPLHTGQNSSVATFAGTGAAANSLHFALNGTGISQLDHFRIVASPASTTVGTPVSFTVTAIDTGGDPYITYLGHIALSSTDSSAQLLAGATYTFTAADAGTHTFAAPAAGIVFNALGTFVVKAADGTYTGASNAVRVLPKPVAAVVTLTSSANPVLVNGYVALTAKVTGSGGTPTGSVQFLDGTTVLGAGTLMNGTATLVVTLNHSGDHALSAVYSGDAAFLGATGTATETAVDFTLALASGASGAATVLAGKQATYALTITPVGAAKLPAGLTLALAGLPTGGVAAFSPTFIATGSAVTPVRLNVSTASAFPAVQHGPKARVRRVQSGAQSNAQPNTWPRQRSATLAAFSFLLPLVLRRRPFQRSLRLLTLACLAVGMSGCVSDASSGFYAGNPSTSTLTVTASSGSLTHTLTLTLQVE